MSVTDLDMSKRIGEAVGFTTGSTRMYAGKLIFAQLMDHLPLHTCGTLGPLGIGRQEHLATS